MAKIFKYKILVNEINIGTEENPEIKQIFATVTRTRSEANEEIAKREAYNGEYTPDDDGLPEPKPRQASEERITELEEALELLLSGVTE